MGGSLITTILIGGLTHHYLGSSLPYCNKVTNFGSIVNPYTVVMRGTEDLRAGFILGTDSACGTIAGPIVSFKKTENVDFVMGFYNTNFRNFHERNIAPPSIFNATPIVGLNYKIPITKNIKLENVVSFGIISQALSISF